VTDGCLANSEKVSHLFLGQPEGLAFKQNLDPNGSIRRGVEDDFVIRWSLFTVWNAVHPFPSCVSLPWHLLQAPAKQKDRLCRYLLAELAFNLLDQSIALLINGVLTGFSERDI